MSIGAEERVGFGRIEQRQHDESDDRARDALASYVPMLSDCGPDAASQADKADQSDDEASEPVARGEPARDQQINDAENRTDDAKREEEVAGPVRLTQYGRVLVAEDQDDPRDNLQDAADHDQDHEQCHAGGSPCGHALDP